MQRHVTLKVAAVSLVAATMISGSAAARDRALQSACFAPDALAAIEDERLVVKSEHDFDKPPKPDAALLPVTPIDVARRGAIRRVELAKGEKLIALTFDLCEQRGEIAGYDGGIVDYLRTEGIKATFFTGGKWMRSHAARTEQLMTDPLFEIANHGENHRNLRLLDAASVQAEIAGPQLAYERARRRLASTQCAARVPEALAAIPTRISLMRFPFGACNPAAMAAANDAGLLAIQWDVSAGDPDPHSTAPMIARGILARAKPGSIIVAHGNGRGWNTAAALPLFIPKLKAMGYSFVTVSELIARGQPVIADSCYDTHPGDTDRYDFLAGSNLARPPGSHAAANELPWNTQTHTPDNGGTFQPSAGKPQPPPAGTAGHNGPSLTRPF